MPYIYDPNRSASRESRQRSLDQTIGIRRGQIGPTANIRPERTAPYKALELKQVATRDIRNPQKFLGNIQRNGNVFEKQTRANQRSIEGFIQRQQMMER
jgi:hypothetical protein